MDRTCKHKFRPGCEDLEGRQLLSQLPSGPGKVTHISANYSSITPRGCRQTSWQRQPWG